MTPSHTTIALADLAGKILEKEDFDTSPDADFMTSQIIGRVAKFASKYKSDELEVGITVPGIADQSTGKSLYIPYFQWHDWDICKEIYKKTNLRATIDNDANAIALAELWFGREKIRGVSNFITVLIADGIGTGIIFDGQVYRGERGAAGEFGHMIVGENAPVQCSCGSRDCWEAHASEKAIIARYQNHFDKSATNGNGINITKLILLANKGDKQAIEALKETAKYIGIGISNLIVGLSPQAVIVSGNITKAWNIISNELLSIAERSVRRDLPAPTIIASTLGDQPTLMGSLSLVLARKFASAVKS